MRNSTKNYLDACFRALSEKKRAMSSKEIHYFIMDNQIFNLSGKTPWKTINARLSAEILKNGSNSVFMRVDQGLFALRDWDNYSEYTVKRRIINPIDEDIAVVPRETFLKFLSQRSSSKFYDIDYIGLVQEAKPMLRLKAEETDDFVQIIPLFFVRKSTQFLSYKRTKRLPEGRLHGTRSINFGGHLQIADFPALFASDIEIVNLALQRELREELSFSPDKKQVTFFGAIYDDTNFFGRQHVGLVFEVEIADEVQMSSNEPGYLTAIKFLEFSEIQSLKIEFDDWTFLVLEQKYGQ